MSTPHEKGPHRELRDSKTTAAPRQRTFVLMYPFLDSPIIQGAYDRYLVCALLTPALHAQPQDPPLAFCDKTRVNAEDEKSFKSDRIHTIHII